MADADPFTTPGALADFEQIAAEAGVALDRVIAEFRGQAAGRGRPDALINTYIGLEVLPAGTIASLLTVAVERLAGTGTVP